MTNEEFIESVKRTWNTDISVEDQRDNALLGIIGENGEVAEILKKTLYHGKVYENEREILIKEVGDILYYLAAYDLTFPKGEYAPLLEDVINARPSQDLSRYFSIGGVSRKLISAVSARLASSNDSYDSIIREAMQVNSDKLKARYPNGFCKAISSVKPDEKH